MPATGDNDRTRIYL